MSDTNESKGCQLAIQISELLKEALAAATAATASNTSFSSSQVMNGEQSASPEASPAAAPEEATVEEEAALEGSTDDLLEDPPQAQNVNNNSSLISPATAMDSSNLFTQSFASANQGEAFKEKAAEVFRLFRTLLDLTVAKQEALNMVALDGPVVFNELFAVSAPFMLCDINLSLYVCSVISNLCVFPDCRDVIDCTSLVDLALQAIRAHPRQKKLVHLALMTVSNLALSGTVELSDSQAESICAAIAPLYEEKRVVEAWVCALCNLAGCSGAETAELLLKHGAFEATERLLLHHGDDARLSQRGLQALGNMSLTYIRTDDSQSSPTSPLPTKN